MDKVLETIQLMAKTGLFFAHCDGQFAKREHDFINAFLEGIMEVGEIPEDLSAQVKDSLNHTYTIDEIIADTERLTDGFNEDERQAILFIISQFIRKVIASDEQVETAEMTYFQQWREKFGF